MEFYKFKRLDFPTGLFDCLDATYVLYLDGSPRIKKVKEQLELCSPSQVVFIVVNPGYKNVNKPLPRQNSEDDVTFSHYVACKHAQKQNFQRILVLEDDFLFEEEILAQDLNTKIKSFLNSTDLDHYHLGSTPFLAFPASINFDHWHVLFGGCAHAVIHSEKGMEKFISEYEKSPEKIKGVDLYFVSNHRTFMFHQPLITQLFPETENKITGWGYGSMGKNFGSWVVKHLSLDTKTRPGFDQIYFTAKIIPFVICAILITILIMVIRMIRNRFSKKMILDK